MICHIYRASKKPETYLYLTTEDDFSVVPEMLLAACGTMEKVMQVDLSKRTRLARVEIEQVLGSLERDGYFLQMPPRPEELSGL